MALITGAASGMGLATAQAFAEADAAFVMADSKEGVADLGLWRRNRTARNLARKIIPATAERLTVVKNCSAWVLGGSGNSARGIPGILSG